MAVGWLARAKFSTWCRLRRGALLRSQLASSLVELRRHKTPWQASFPTQGSKTKPGAGGESRLCREAAACGRSRGVRREGKALPEWGTGGVRPPAVSGTRLRPQGAVNTTRLVPVARVELTFGSDSWSLPWGSQAWRKPDRRGGWLAYDHSLLKVSRVVGWVDEGRRQPTPPCGEGISSDINTIIINN